MAAARVLTFAVLFAAAVLAQDIGVPGSGERSPETTAAPIAAPAAPRLAGEGNERVLARRLQAIYRNLSDLADVTVEVGTGVVRLDGEAATLEAREQAARIARDQEGVVAVDNRIRVRRGLAEQLAPAWKKLLSSATSFVALLPLLIAALVVMAIAWALSRLAGRWSAPYRRLVRNRFGADLLRQVVQTSIFLAGVVLSLQVAGAGTLAGAALGSAGLIGLVIGFAFRDLVENYMASVLLSLRRPFDPGDLVEVEGRAGKVIRLTSRATLLMTPDGNHLRIPNAQVYKGVIVNFTRNPERRLQFTVPIAADSDVLVAQQAGERAMLALPGILAQPEPWTATEEVADSWVVLRYHAWVDQRSTDFLKARSEAVRAVLEALAHAGVELPKPSYRLEVHQVEEEGAAPVPPRREGPDLTPDRHLDARIAAERAVEEDLLATSAETE